MQVIIWGQIFFKRKGIMGMRTKLSQARGMRHIQILFKFLSYLSQKLELRNSKKCVMGWFKQFMLNQIRGGLLKESQMINAWFRLLKFPNNQFNEIRSWLPHYARKIFFFPFRILSRLENALLSFMNTFLFLKEANRETNHLFLFYFPSFHFN